MSVDLNLSNGDIGWISTQELDNAFTEALRQLDKYIMPEHSGTPWGVRMAVLKHVETIKYALRARAKANYETFLIASKPAKALPNLEANTSLPKHQERLSTIKARS